MSDEPVNLNKFRKAKARQAARKSADTNAIRFGQTKAERLLQATQNEKARAMLDRHKMDEPE